MYLMWISYEDVLVPAGFKAVSVEENPHAIPTRKVYIMYSYNTMP